MRRCCNVWSSIGNVSGSLCCLISPYPHDIQHKCALKCCFAFVQIYWSFQCNRHRAWCGQ
jgi:hypothetical protein